MKFQSLLVLIVISSLLRLETSNVWAQSPKASIKKGAAGVAKGDSCDPYMANPTELQRFKNKIKNRIRSLGITWFYNWYVDAKASSCIDGVVEYVPMVWGGGTYWDETCQCSKPTSNRHYSQANLESYKAYAREHPGSYWLIWNEPDFHEQANIPVEKAAEIYQPLQTAISNADPAAKFIIGGLYDSVHWHDWMRTFINEYRLQHQGANPVFHGWHIHYYTCNYDSAVWQNKIADIRYWVNLIGGGPQKDLWLTEFGCFTSRRDQIIRDQLDWMETFNGIQRYAWFYAAGDSEPQWPETDLYNSYSWDDSRFGLSTLGEVYAQFPQNPTPFPTFTPYPTMTPRPTRTPTPTQSVPSPTTNPTCLCTEQGIIDRCSFGCSSVGTSNFACVIPATPTEFNHCDRIERKNGDADGQNGVNVDDFDYYQRTVLFDTNIPPSVNADFNGDGQVGTPDGQIVLRTLGLL